jgi:hypothetical protein
MLYTPPVATTDWMAQWGLGTGSERSATTTQSRKLGQTWSFRGSKSRNKVFLPVKAINLLKPDVGDYKYNHEVRSFNGLDNTAEMLWSTIVVPAALL